MDKSHSLQAKLEKFRVIFRILYHHESFHEIILVVHQVHAVVGLDRSDSTLEFPVSMTLFTLAGLENSKFMACFSICIMEKQAINFQQN